MGSRYAIETIFSLIDNITKPLDNIGLKSETVSSALKDDFVKTQRQVKDFGASVKKWGGRMLAAGIVALGVGLGIAAHQFIEYEAAVTAATAKFKDVDVTSAEYVTTLEAIGKTAREVAAITEFTAVDTAGALDKMAMAGLRSDQAMALLMGTTNLATATTTDLTTAVDIVTDSLGAFGLMSEDTEILTGNMDRLSDVIAKTTNMFNTDIGGFFESATKGAATFTAAGQSLEDFSAMVGVLASSGIKGSEAGTQLRNMILSLSAPSSTAQAALDRLGISVSDSSGNFLNIIDIIEQFEDAFGGADVAKKFAEQVAGLEDIEGFSVEEQMDQIFSGMMGTSQKMQELNDVFGKRTVTGMLLLLAEGTDKLRGFSGELQNAAGSAEAIAGAIRGSIKNQIEVLKSGLTELGFKFVEAFQTRGSAGIVMLTEAVANFDPTALISFMISAFDNIVSLVSMLWKMRDVILALVIAWGIYKAVMIAAVVIAPIIGMIKAVQALMVAQQGMNVVQAIFNVLLNANPIGLIITALGVLILIIIQVVKHWDEINAVLSEHTEKVLGILTIITGPLGFLISMIVELKENWGLVTEAFKSEGILGGLKRLGGVLLSGILMPIQGILEVIAKIPGVGKFAAAGVEKIEGLRNSLKGLDTVTIGNDSSEVESENPSTLSPVTPEERMMYSRSESIDRTDVYLHTEKGVSARWGDSGPGRNMQLIETGAN